MSATLRTGPARNAGSPAPSPSTTSSVPPGFRTRTGPVPPTTPQLRAAAACHPQADGSVWLRHAAEGGSAAAQVRLAADLLSGTADAGQVARARTLLQQAANSDSYYVAKHAAALLAASPVQAVRDAAAARVLARKLSAGEIQSDPQMFEVLAAAAAANDDFRDAVQQQQLALQKAQALGWNTHEMGKRLAAYRAGKPWYGDLLR